MADLVDRARAVTREAGAAAGIGPPKAPVSTIAAMFGGGATAVDDDTVVGSCVLAYGIMWPLVAGVREHASA